MTRDDALATLHAAARLAARRGSLLFHLDLATELARVALERASVPVDLLAPLAGPDGYEVHALAEGASLRTVARVAFDAEGRPVIVRRSAGAPPLTEVVARARRTIGAAAPRHAAIVIPHAGGGAIDGYAVAVAPYPGAPVTQGHRRCMLTPDGRSLLSCEALPLGDQQASGAFTSDAAVPDALYVYLSLKHGRSWSVATAASGLAWTVDGERVEPHRGAASTSALADAPCRE